MEAILLTDLPPKHSHSKIAQRSIMSPVKTPIFVMTEPWCAVFARFGAGTGSLVRLDHLSPGRAVAVGYCIQPVTALTARLVPVSSSQIAVPGVHIGFGLCLKGFSLFSFSKKVKPLKSARGSPTVHSRFRPILFDIFFYNKWISIEFVIECKQN